MPEPGRTTPRWRAGTSRWHVAVLVLGAAGAGMIYLATSSSFFVADDLPNFEIAMQRGLGWSGLTESYFGTFAPAHRALDWLVFKAGSAPSWAFARLVLLLGYAVGVAAVWRLGRELSTRWVALLGVVVFAFSPAHVRAVQWWANGAHVTWSLSLTAVALAAAAGWLRRRSPFALGVVVVAQAGALLFYSKPVLTPLYVLAIVLVREPERLSARRVSAAMRRAGPLLCLSFGLSAVYVLGVRLAGYSETPGTASASDWLAFLRLDWLRGATPLLIGQTVPRAAEAGNVVAIAAAQVVLLTLAIVSIRRWPRAWRAWTAYLVLFLANAAIPGLGRLALYGPELGLDPRYNAEFALVFPLILALAWERHGAWPARAMQARGRVVHLSAVAGATGIALLVASAALSAVRVDRAWEGRDSRNWYEAFSTSLAKYEAAGTPVRVIDEASPGVIVEIGQLSTTMALLGSDATFSGPLAGRQLVAASASGLLVPTSVTTSVDGVPGRLLAAKRIAPTGSTSQQGGDLCLEASTQQTSLDVLDIPAGGSVVLDLATAPVSAATIFQLYAAKPGEAITGPVGESRMAAGASHVQATIDGPAVDLRMTLKAPQRLCIRRLTVRTQR